MKAREEGIIGQVRHALATEARVEAPRISITMIDSQLHLSGVVDDAEQATIAEEVARRAAPGVPIENDLTVGGIGHANKRGALTERVLAAIAEVKGMLGDPAADVGAQVREGVAYLYGQVATIEDREAVRAAAGGVPGVGGVDADRLRVAPFTDAFRTASLARERLQAAAPDLAGAVRVYVHERSARLVGRLRNAADRERAIAIVKQVQGINTVHDEFGLYQAGDASTGADAQLEQAVRRALGEAGLPVPDLAVFALDGAITLMGAVASPEAHRLATRICTEVVGARRVDNQLDIIAARGPVPHPPGDRRQDLHKLPKRETGKRD